MVSAIGKREKGKNYWRIDQVAGVACLSRVIDEFRLGRKNKTRVAREQAGKRTHAVGGSAAGYCMYSTLQGDVGRMDGRRMDWQQQQQQQQDNREHIQW
jgi:hypothetical protein